MHNYSLQMYRCSFQLIPDEQMSLSVIGSGKAKHKPKGKNGKKKNVVIYAKKSNLKQILKQLTNSRNKIIINIIVTINNSQNINSPGAVSLANQGINQQTHA